MRACRSRSADGLACGHGSEQINSSSQELSATRSSCRSTSAVPGSWGIRSRVNCAFFELTPRLPTAQTWSGMCVYVAVQTRAALPARFDGLTSRLTQLAQRQGVRRRNGNDARFFGQQS